MIEISIIFIILLIFRYFKKNIGQSIGSLRPIPIPKKGRYWPISMPKKGRYWPIPILRHITSLDPFHPLSHINLTQTNSSFLTNQSDTFQFTLLSPINQSHSNSSVLHKFNKGPPPSVQELCYELLTLKQYLLHFY